MSIRNLHHALDPTSLAIIGASDRDGSLGRVVIENVIRAGFEGEIWPINPKHDQVAGHRCYRRVAMFPVCRPCRHCHSTADRAGSDP